MLEHHIAGDELISALASVIDDITKCGFIYLVHLGPAASSGSAISGLLNSIGELVFALGRPDDLGLVFSQIDEEYGWPDPVQLAEAATVGDLTPGYRRQPLLFMGNECVAMSVRWCEYEQLNQGDKPLA